MSRRPSIVEIPDIFFQPMHNVNPGLKGLTWRPDAIDRWNAFVPQVEPLIQSGAVVGFFLGDELVWSNITWTQLNLSSSIVKQSFPSCWIFYNEGGAPLWGSYNMNHFHVDYPFVPPAIDYVSTDDYDDMSAVKNPVWMYRKYLYPKMMHNHQRAFVIPPVYGRSDDASCSSSCWDLRQLNQTQQYFRWIEQDELIVGIDGFHMQTYGSDLGLVDLPQTLSCYQTLAKQLL
jgi:hypothetical protein